MMERKFTDDEIVKALECCSKKTLVDDFCDVCPNLGMGSKCMDNMLCDALDLINRQNAEIESLNERERILIYHVAVEQERAIKEFAERLKAKAYEGQGFYSVFTVRDIDNLVKEMTGADNGN